MSNQTFKISTILEADGTKHHRVMNQAGADIDKFKAKGKDAGSGFRDVLGGNLASNAVSQLTSLMVEGGRSILDYSANMEQTRIGFETLMGGAQSAQKHLDELKRFAAVTPFDFPTLTAASRRFQNVGLEAKRVIPIMTAVGDAVAAAGGSSETLDQVTLAISQIAAKGKVSAEEINQLAEAGIGGWRILSEQLGMTTGEVMKLAEQGKISSEVFLQAFEAFSKKNYGDAMKKQAGTFRGAMSTIQDTVMSASESAFEPLYKKISELAVEASQEIQAQGDDLEAVGAVVGKYLTAGITAGLAAGVSGAVERVVSDIGSLFSEENLKKQTPIWMKFSEVLVEGVGRGLGYKWDVFAQNISTKTNPAVRELDALLGSINVTTEKTPSLDKKLEAEKARDNVDKLLKQMRGSVLAPLINATGFIGKLDETLKKTNEEVKKTPSLAEQLKADKAKKETETLRDVITDLGLEVRFFGDESEVAATKQKLLSQGILDLESGLAKSALKWAEYLDKLKKAKKEQDEYTEKLKDWRADLEGFAETALEAFIPKQTELDRFDKWVKSAKAGMSDLKYEIASTRDFLKEALAFKELVESQERFKGFNQTLDETINQVLGTTHSISPLRAAILDIAKSARLAATEVDTLSNLTGIDSTAATVARNVEKYLQDIKALRDKYNQQVAGINEGESAGIAFATFTDQYNKRLKDARESLEAFLRTLKTINADGKEVALFDSQYQIDAAIQKFEYLDRVVRQSQIVEGAKTIGDELERLGVRIGNLGARTDLEKINRLLSDQAVTEAIRARAAALGYSADELRDLLRLVAESKILAEGASRPRYAPGTRPRRVPGADINENGRPGGFMEGFEGGWRDFEESLFGENSLSKFETEAEKIKAVYRDIGEMAQNTVAQMVEGVGQLVESWVLYGELGPDALKKMTAQVLASLAAEAAIKAVFQLAEGFAALFFNPAEAAAHFKAAALYGAVAVTAGVAGRAIAGDSFKKDSKSKGGSFSGSAYGSNDEGNREQNYVRASSGNFFNRDRRQAQIDEAVQKLSENVGALADKISGMKPGDVLTVGANQKPGFLADRVQTELSKNSTLAVKTGKTLGMR